MLTNIAINCQNPTHWFVTKESEKIQPSEAEKIIIRALNGHSIEYYTEVSFLGMKYSTNGYARYDIWLPTMNTLIEYDGEQYHNTEDQQERDKLKTQFCRRNSITLIRYNKYQYYTLGQEIAKLILRGEKIKSKDTQVSKPAQKSKKQHKKGKKNKKQRNKEALWAQIKERRNRPEKPKPKKTQEEIRKLINAKINTSTVVIPKIAGNRDSIKKPISQIMKKLKTGGVKYGTGK